jgi:hypothetical protein
VDDAVDEAGAAAAPAADWPASGQGDLAVSERGLRGLVGSGSSQVTVGAAMRARDAARPGEEELARAEADLAVVRRYWSPRDASGFTPPGAQPGSGGSAGRADS